MEFNHLIKLDAEALSIQLLMATLLAALVITKFTSATTKSLPGPRGLPVIGNVLDFPQEKPWVTFSNWKEKYGNIIYLNVLGKPIIVLNTRDVCIDIFDKHSAKTSGRPKSVILNEFMGFDWSLAIMDYSPRWRRYRRLFHQFFNEREALTYRPILEHGVHKFLHRLLTEPENFLDHSRLAFGGTILDIVYGIKAENRDNTFIQASEKAIQAVQEVTVPGKFCVEFFPALKYLPSWFPGGTFKKFTPECRQVVFNARDLAYDFVKKRIEAGIAGSSVLCSMLERCNQESINGGASCAETPEVTAKSCAAIAYIAGADTTVSMIQTVFMALANHPEVQREAWKELDGLLGPSPNRLPTQSDEAQLPFITAMTKELLRWHNPIPLMPHASTEDDEYNGYFIPKGTLLLANIWSVLRDPEVYPDPFVFNPWRWLIDTPEGPKLNSALPDPNPVFGFGRRICPGRHLAANTLFPVIASVLTCFHVKPLDINGRPINSLDEEFSDGTVVTPIPYKVSITPRSPHFERLIKDMMIEH